MHIVLLIITHSYIVTLGISTPTEIKSTKSDLILDEFA